MGNKLIGSTIAKLRRKCGLTQTDLARICGISDKAVSKWESGQGFPDISLLPILSETFGVSIDHIMMGADRSITIAGNIIIDIVKDIEVYPSIGMLSNISNVTTSVGGCAPNTAINLAKMDRSMPIEVIGKIGEDEHGRYIVSQLQKYGINASKVTTSSTNPTGFTDVMSIPSGERTFFHKRGANTEFCPDDIDIKKLACEIFHIGYILLLDKFDEEDPKYGTVMARFLSELQKNRIKTSIDVVSDSSGQFSKKIIPALKYCNYVIINEIECCSIWGIDAYDADGNMLKDNIRLAMEKTMEAGVSDLVVVHSKERCFSLNFKGVFTEVPSLNIPSSIIKGTVGAGDAFCAGCLFALYHRYNDKRMLEFASAAAACNLMAANSVDGMLPKEEILEIEKKYGRLPE